MTPKDIVLSAIQFKNTPRLPIAVLDGYLWMIRKRGISFKDLFETDDGKAVELILNTYQELGSDIVYGNSTAINVLREVMGGVLDYSSVGKMVTTMSAAMKELSDIGKFDVHDVFSKIVSHPYYVTMTRQLEMLASKISDEKLIMGFTSGPLTMAASLCGVQELMTALYEDSDTVRKTLDFVTEMNIRMLEYQIQHGATAISIADPVASVNLISGEFFEEFALPSIQKVTAALKKYHVPIVLHICGDTTSRLEPLKAAGIDVFSVDSIDLKNALFVAKGHYAIFGNLSPVNVLQNKSAQEVYELASELANIAGLGGGFIMAPGCDLPPDTPIENVRAMVTAAGHLTA